jgi:hypothetical protein
MANILDCNLPTIPDVANLALEEPVTLEEISREIKRGKPNKAPGYDWHMPRNLVKNVGDFQERPVANNERNVSRRNSISPAEVWTDFMHAKTTEFSIH